MIYFCCEEKRRELLLEANAARKAAAPPQTPLNGIDFLEVLDHDAPAGIDRQRTLLIRFFEPAPTLTVRDVLLLGGERITPVKIEWLARADQLAGTPATAADQAFAAALSGPDHLLFVRTDSTGDYSTYRISLLNTADEDRPPPNFDPLFCAVDFSFKVECPSDFDCRAETLCPVAPETPPAIDYLAKDYASFRRLILDRLAVLMPKWRERNPADIGVTLAELFAYVGDQLSYQQDATATEAYLTTARRRISVRRHARLLDYAMHDGSNARAWVHFTAAAGVNGTPIPARTPLLTATPRAPVRLSPNSDALDRALLRKPVVFETMRAVSLFAEHNEMAFYTWGDSRCCLPKGATRATLKGHFPNLQAGDALLFEEIRGPKTFETADADRAHRHVVRLTKTRSWEAPGVPLTDPLTGQAVTEVYWDFKDAPPLAFSLDSRPGIGGGPREEVTVARGNLVLADHGQTIRNENLGQVPTSRLSFSIANADRCADVASKPAPPRFSPALRFTPITQALPDRPDQPASAERMVDIREALPVVSLRSTLGSRVLDWSPVRDLLQAAADDAAFVVEVEADGTTSLRFGNDQQGRRPDEGASFVAIEYRVGNGSAGNIGADALFHCVTEEAAVVSVRNPLEAWGGTDGETSEDVRQRAPMAFREPQRAVTEDDYAMMAARDPDIQKAEATFRWTGSWHTVFVTADRIRGQRIDEPFRTGTRNRLEPFRMAGHDLEFDPPRPVSLEIVLHVCVKPEYFRTQVRAALLDVFSNRLHSDGRRGLFHPDNFTFGQPVYLSALYAAAQAVPGVQSAHAEVFQRLGKPETSGLADGRLLMDRLEIARCDNDPNFPENGLFRLDLGGGK